MADDPRPPDPTALVAAGYDHIAASYLASKQPLSAEVLVMLHATVAGLPPTATVLDLGCGAGVPVTAWLAQRHAVTGVDCSATQLALAAQHAPSARLIKADMTAFDASAASFDAVVALHSIIHVPREQQAALVARIAGWLRPGGRFLATWKRYAWEGSEPDWNGWGAPMWWSLHDDATNQTMLTQAGLTIERTDAIGPPDDRWLWRLARRPSA